MNINKSLLAKLSDTEKAKVLDELLNSLSKCDDDGEIIQEVVTSCLKRNQLILWSAPSNRYRMLRY